MLWQILKLVIALKQMLLVVWRIFKRELQIFWSIHKPESLSYQKAHDVFKDNQDDVVIGADTIVVVDGVILGKPKNEQEAKDFLRLLSYKSHKVITGCCLRNNKNISRHFSQETIVKFKELTEEEIDYYVNKFKPFDKAGAYGIQEWIGTVGIEDIQGDYYNVVGFPCNRFFELAKEIME